jgi:site-specific recombinase XerD
MATKTISTYGEAVTQLITHLTAKGMPTDVSSINREHVESFIEHLLAEWTPSTAANRYGGLRAFFKWAVEDGEIKDSPMAKMRPPKVPEQVVPILTEQEIERFFKACSGQDYEARRDLAVMRMFATTGARKSEIANLRFSPDDPMENDVDLDVGVVRVVGKGGRDRLLPLDPRTIRAVDRYIRKRASHHSAHLPYLWLGKRGRMTPDGIAQMAMRRAKQAGLTGFHLHRLRHSFAHFWLASGGGESDLMRIAGWRSRSMLSRYGASAAQERALEAAKKFGVGSRL